MGEKFVGGEPHGQLHTVYINPLGFDALRSSLGALPNRSIVLKENYTVDGVLENVTIMYKVEAYNPQHNDWFWAMVGADGQVRREGMLEGCQVCHGARAANDYIMVGDLR